MFDRSLQGNHSQPHQPGRTISGGARASPALVALVLLAAHAPALALGGNRFGFLAPSIALVLALLILRARHLTPPPIASWLWLAVMGWGAAQIGLGLTPDPGEGARVLTRYAYYAAIFLLVADIAASRRRARFMVQATALWIATICTFGMAAWATGFNPVVGALEAYPTALEATFVNRNAFALYAGFGLFAALAAWRLGRTDLRGLAQGGWIWPAAAMTCLIALILTGSRGGVGSVAIGLIVFAIVSGAGRASMIICLGFAAVAIVGAVLARATMVMDDPRFEVQAQVLTAVAEAPWIGHGVGGFQDSFRATLGATWRWGDWDHAHQQYLETAYELGLPAAAALILAVAMIAPRPRRRSPFAAMGLAALVAAALHALVDFSLAIPSVAITLALMLGVAQGRGDHMRGRS